MLQLYTMLFECIISNVYHTTRSRTSIHDICHHHSHYSLFIFNANAHTCYTNTYICWMTSWKCIYVHKFLRIRVNVSDDKLNIYRIPLCMSVYCMENTWCDHKWLCLQNLQLMNFLLNLFCYERKRATGKQELFASINFSNFLTVFMQTYILWQSRNMVIL